MRAFFLGILTLLRKEMKMILKDPRGRAILVAPIIVQTILFGYVATYDLNLVEYAILDEDHSAESRELAARFKGATIFREVAVLRNAGEIAGVIETKRALMAIHIGRDFARRLALGDTAPVQIIVDGRNSNVAGTAQGYASAIVQDFSQKRLAARGISPARVHVQTRAWFNPNLETRWGILAGLSAVLAAVQVLILSALSVAREKEQGTFDQLLVTPLNPSQILWGKALPPVLVGLLQSSLVFLVSQVHFHIPFQGAIPLFYAGLVLYNFALVGIGLCISTFSSTMQQALLYTFTLLMPMILLSGFTTPISSMPDAFQAATLLNPIRYGVELTQRIYLEGTGGAGIWPTFWPLAIIAAVTLGVASRLFRTRLG